MNAFGVHHEQDGKNSATIPDAENSQTLAATPRAGRELQVRDMHRRMTEGALARTERSTIIAEAPANSDGADRSATESQEISWPQ